VCFSSCHFTLGQLLVHASCVILLSRLFIWLEAKLQPNIEFTLQHVLMVFTRLAITPLKVNWFAWSLELSEYIVWGWSWQILSTICTVATAGELGEILFVLSGKHKQCTISLISRQPNLTKFAHNTSISDVVNPFVTEFRKFYRKGSCFQRNAKLLQKIQRLATSGCHNSATIIDRWKFNTKWATLPM